MKKFKVEIRNNNSAYFSNPLDCDDFKSPYIDADEKFSQLRQAIHPKKNAAESFDHYYSNKGWSRQWRGFRAQYTGNGETKGEFISILQDHKNDSAEIQFGKAPLKSMEYWTPNLNNSLTPPFGIFFSL